VESLKLVLDTYCEASGQRINLQKSSIFFGNHCQDDIKVYVKEKLNVATELL
jgi:hypothetical protein